MIIMLHQLVAALKSAQPSPTSSASSPFSATIQ